VLFLLVQGSAARPKALLIYPSSQTQPLSWLTARYTTLNVEGEFDSMSVVIDAETIIENFYKKSGNAASPTKTGK
jgi:hypothetical protein